jgi:hypothetical protein
MVGNQGIEPCMRTGAAFTEPLSHQTWRYPKIARLRLRPLAWLRHAQPQAKHGCGPATRTLLHRLMRPGWSPDLYPQEMVPTLPTRRRRSQSIRADRELKMRDSSNQPAYALRATARQPSPASLRQALPACRAVAREARFEGARLAKALPRRSAAKAGGGELRNRTPIPKERRFSKPLADHSARTLRIGFPCPTRTGDLDLRRIALCSTELRGNMSAGLSRQSPRRLRATQTMG